MKLKSIDIRAANSWEDWDGYRGEAEFEGPTGKITLTLTEGLSKRVIMACADALVESASAQADALRDSAARATGILIDHKEPAA